MTVVEEKGLHNLGPAKGSTKDRKRVGRGPGSGTGKRSGRGQKGQKSRSGSHNVRPGFEGGQFPSYMRIGKLRGSNKKMSMPMGPFRTFAQPVNVGALSDFDAGTEVTGILLAQAGLIRTARKNVKILGEGELTVKLKVVAHGFSAQAKAKIEAAGGTWELVPGPKPHGRVLTNMLKAEARLAVVTARGKGAKPAAAAAPKAEPEADTDADA
ncbi:MAG: 50S ribosomal protein L15 [Thermoleophilia bacterium]|nr:50S ribosomal protein L15 [Thermoleophilia bacterium]